MPKGKYLHHKITGKKRPEHSQKMKELAKIGRHPFQNKTIESREKQSESLKRKYREGKIVNSMKGKIRLDLIERNKKTRQDGKNNGNYRHGYYCGESNPRYSKEYKLWRLAVFERDKYTCIWCGRVGGKLQADHIKPFSIYPELRFAIDNGRTLCVDCHRKTDTYLRGVKKRR